MRARPPAIVGLITLAVTFVAAKDKEPAAASGANNLVSISATVFTTKEQIQELLGSDLGGFYSVVRLTVTPKSGKLKIDGDDFLLLTHKDGERTHPMAPNQIAGDSDFVVHQVLVGPRGPGADRGGTVYLPGGMGTSSGVGSHGDSSAPINATTAAPKPKGKSTPNPMLAVLKEKMLPNGETDHPASGLLIFSLEKQKPKDLELIYTTADGPIKIQFR